MANNSMSKMLNLYYLNPSIAFFRGLEIEEVEKVITGVKPEKPVLDLGCGNGLIFWSLFGKYRDNDLVDNYTLPFLKDGEMGPDPDKRFYFGVDRDISVLAQAKKLNLYQKLMCANVSTLPFSGNYFGTVFSNCVIEHVEDLDSCLAEVARVLSKNGKFIFTVPSHYFDDYLLFAYIARKLGMNRIAKKIAIKKNERLAHLNILTIEEWESKLRDNGFKLNLYKYYLPPKAEIFWDALLLFSEIGVGKYTLLSAIKKLFSPLSKRKLKFHKGILVRLEKGIFKHFTPLIKGSIGGGVLIVAEKEGGGIN